MPIEAIVMPSWQAARTSSSFSSCSSTSSTPALPVLRERLEPPAARTHQRELRGDEDAVEDHQDEQRYERYRGHRATGLKPVLGGWSSSIGDVWRIPRTQTSGTMSSTGASRQHLRPSEVPGLARLRGMDQDRVPYVDALREHAARNPARLTVPGHKGGVGADPAMIDALGQKALDMDLPALIEGIDVGPPDPNPFEQAQELAADAWGAARTWFLVGGASQGNHAALLALRHTGRSIVMQRNVHSSAIDGSILADMDPSFIAPEIDPELGVAHCPTPGALEAALDAAPDAVGALDRLAHLLRRLRRRGGPRRDLPLARPAPDRRRGVGRAHHLLRRASPGRAGGGCRPRHLLDAQDHRQPHPVGDDPPGPRQPDRRVDRRPRGDASRVDQPELAS